MIDKKELYDLLNILQIPYCIINEKGIFSKVSSAYCDLVSYQAFELLGKHFSFLLPNEKDKNIQLEFFNKFKNFTIHPELYNIVSKLGEPIKINTISYDFTDLDGLNYRLTINYKIDEKFYEKVMKESYEIADDSLLSLKKSINNFIFSNSNPVFTLINIKLSKGMPKGEFKSFILDIIKNKLNHIFTDNKEIFYHDLKFWILVKDLYPLDFLENKLHEILNFFKHPFNYDNSFYKKNIKIGVTYYDKDQKFDFNEIYGLSELALENTQWGSFSIIDEEFLMKMNNESKLESIIFNSYKNNEFIPYFQYYYDINTKEPKGIEALMRLNSKEYGNISPKEFIPILEKNLYIISVERQVIEIIFKKISDSRNNKIKIPPISINLSALQFNNMDFLTFIISMVDNYNVQGSDIIFEITESILMKDLEMSLKILNELKSLGFSISIDDFGTGYSSLAYLKKFPIDNLKIDISFIRDIHQNESNRIIVEATIAMAHKLGLKTICEGIEKVEELEVLRTLGADYIQGYLWHKPSENI